MPIQFSCPHCGKSFAVKDDLAGKSAKCKSCGQTITVPDGSAALPPVKKPPQTNVFPKTAPTAPAPTWPAVQVDTGGGPTVGSPGGSSVLAGHGGRRKSDKTMLIAIFTVLAIALVGVAIAFSMSGDGQDEVADGGGSTPGPTGVLGNIPAPANPVTKPPAPGLADIIPGNIPTPPTNGNGGIVGTPPRDDKAVSVTGPLPDGSLMTFKGPEPWAISKTAISPDGRYALSGITNVSKIQPMRYWDLKEGRCIQTLEGHAKDVTAIAISPDGRRSLSGAQDRIAKYWDLQTGKCIHAFEGHNSTVKSLSFTHDGNRAIAVSSDKIIYLWDLQKGNLIRSLKWPHPIQFAAVVPDNRFVLFGDGYKAIVKWNLETGETTELFETEVQFDLSVITPDCRFALVKKYYVNDEFLYLVDLQTGKSTKTCESNQKYIQSIKCLAISPDGRYAACGTQGFSLSAQPTNAEVRCWDLQTGEIFHQYTGHESRVTTVNITPDGRHVLSSGRRDKTLKLWNLR